MYNIPTPVVVMPYNALAASLANAISANDPNSLFLNQLNSGNLNLVAKNVIALTTVFNIQSVNTAASASPNLTQIAQLNEQMADLREFMVNKVTNLSVSDLSSIKVISSALSAATQTPEQVSSKTAVILNLHTINNLH